MQNGGIAAKWNALSVGERTKVLHRDKSMRHPTWKSLVERMASSQFEELTTLQREGVEMLLKFK